MENAVDSLKIAFGVLIFTVALSISISTFSNARRAIDGITTIKDKTQEYVYLEPSTTSNRDVGIETIIPALYKAYSENYRVEFWVKDSAGAEKKLILYSRRNVEARENWEEVNYIDLIDENFGSESLAIDHLNALLTNGHTKFYTQNTTGVTDIMEVTPKFLAEQLDSIFTDINPDAIKTGMVSSSELIETIADKLTEYHAKNIVVDPVIDRKSVV